MMKTLMHFGLTFCALLLSAGMTLAEPFRLKLTIDLGQELAKATVSISVLSSNALSATTDSVPVSRATREVFFERAGGYVLGADRTYAMMYGSVIGEDQSVAGYIPVQIIDFKKLARRDLIELRVTTVPTAADAFVRSFPLSSSLQQSIADYGLEPALIGTRIMFNQRLVQSESEWQRLTSDYLKLLGPLLKQDSTKLAPALRYLEEYVRMADRPEYDRFYVEFLLQLKEMGIGGADVGGRSLDDVIISALNDIYAQRLASTYQWAPNTIRTFVKTNPPNRRQECLDLSTVLMNALDGAFASQRIELAATRGELISFMQASTECAQTYFLTSDDPRASRSDVAAASDYLLKSEKGRSFMERYIALFERGEAAGHFPRQPRGNEASRVREVSKYYNEFFKAITGSNES
jgi:hypothetical protein